MAKGTPRLPTDLRVPQAPPAIPAFELGDWVRLIWQGHNTTGQVTQTGLENGFRFVSFAVVDSAVQYTVPPELVERVLSPALEDAAMIILGEDLVTTETLEHPFTIDDARAIVTKIAAIIRADEGSSKSDTTGNADTTAN